VRPVRRGGAVEWGRAARLGRADPPTGRGTWASGFEAHDDAGPCLAEQWRRKRLHLIPIPGTNQAEQEQQFLRFLDRLADRVAMPRQQLFLAPEVEVSPGLAPLRGPLAGQVDAAVEGLLASRGAATPLPAAETRYLAQVLGFLTEHGWRPSGRGGWDLCRLWECLADRAADVRERRRQQPAALNSTEAFTDVQRVRRRLEDLEKGGSADTHPGAG
jgi:hypothetical protein